VQSLADFSKLCDTFKADIEVLKTSLRSEVE